MHQNHNSPLKRNKSKGMDWLIMAVLDEHKQACNDSEKLSGF